MEKRVFKSNFLKGAVYAAACALLCAALLTCSNSAGGSDAPVSQKDSPVISSRPGYVILNGTVNASGAVPQILADTPDSSENENDLSRSARPGIDASGADATMEYFATATCGSDVVNGTFGSGREAKKFGIELAASKTWSVVVGVRSKTADAEGNKKIYLQSKPWSVTPDPADPTISHIFVPVPNTSGGEGKIELNVNCSASSNSLRVKFISGPDGVDLSAISATVTNNGVNGQIIKVDSVHSGVYELCLDFLTIPENMLEYSSLQTVTVADGMTTNAWVDDANESALSPISGGEFKFNNDNRAGLTAAFLGTTVFVGKVSSDSAEPDDSNSGNFLSPLKTITRAAERINAVGNGGLDYYIRVSGEVSGSQIGSAAVIQNLAAAKAKSLTIIGTSGPDTDCIKSVTYQHSALNVTTPVPIKLKNIKIVGATGEGQGDAVSAWGSANVIIEDNVEITGADVGVEVSGSASVTMKGGTIAGNGVAVDMKAGSFVVQGGSIPYDSANKKNYVKTASEKFVTAKGDLAAVDASGGKIAIEPAQKKRGVKLIDASAATASDTDIEAKFMVYDPTISAENPSGDEWQLVSAAADRALKINAPIYVGQTPEGYAGNNDNPGTKSLPYFSIERACQDMDDADMPYTINVRGNLRAQTISSALSKSSSGEYKAKSVLIKGVNPIPTSGENAGIPLDQIQVGVGVLSTVTSGLTVESTVPITIQNLKITGGEHANGGGLYLNSGTEVHLESGVLITDNTAKNHGGGVYCAGGKLYIKEGAKICGNHVSPSSGNYGGIGLYATGDSVIEMTGGEISGNKDTSHVDVVGGGVKLEGSASFKMSGGEVKDNQVVRAGGNFYVTGGGDSGPSVTLSGSAKITGGLADSSSTSYDALGGAVWLEGAGSRLDMSGGEISGNKAKSSDGKNACAGIYVSGATFTMSGGKISGNNVLGGNSQGGAVRLNGKFNISGSAYIPYGGAVGNNDVFLAQSTSGTPAVTTYAKINIANDITTTGTVATITPQKYKRGMPILSGTSTLLSSHQSKFQLSDGNNADWDRSSTAVSTAVSNIIITSPVYVAGASATRVSGVDYGKGLTTAEGGLGTKSKPFKFISDAVAVFEDASSPAVVTIVGTTYPVAQEIPDTFTTTSNASALTLKGLSSSSVGTIKRYTTAPSSAASDGSALKVNSTVPVTIQDITITGGKTSGNGGGINIAKTGASVTLSSGAKVTGNTAVNGGGVYVAASQTLALIGSDASPAEVSQNTVEATDANASGGGIYNAGTVTISGTAKINQNTAKVTSSTKTVTANGGGVYNDKGTLKTESNGSLEISSNKAVGVGTSTSYSSAAYGGGVCNSLSGGSITVTSATSFAMDGNSATVTNASGTINGQGGAIYNIGGTVDLSLGNIGTTELNTSTVNGGAIYVGGTVKLGGSVCLYNANNAAAKNDIFLPNGMGDKTIDVAYNISTSGKVATITQQKWKRGSVVLAGTYAASYYSKFEPSDKEWSVGYNAGGKWTLNDDLKTRVGADIYVAGSSGRADGIGAPDTDSNGALGTKAKPYDSIEEAVKQCWNSSLPFTIKFSGTIKDKTQTIPAGNSTQKTGLASAITIEGFTGNSSDIINRNLSSAPTSGGSALTISTATPVTLKNIKITGGYSKTNGGGILVNGVKAASLTLTTGALVTKNTATKSGGGIYFVGKNETGGTANLIMNDTAKIDGNTASGTGSNDGGGGVYLSYANLCMSGKSVIGDTSGSAAATSSSTGHSNTGYYGGGVFAYTGGNVYVGYKTTGTTDNAYTTSYGILHNYSSRGGGGINVSDNAKLYLAYGSISKNGAGDSGGAVTIQTSGSMTMSGGAMALNSGVAGGAVAVVGTFEMTGGTIGNASKSTPATGATACSNYASSSTLGGGAIWAIAGSTVTVTDGTIAYNYAAGNGGAIHASGESGKTTTINLGGGSVYANAAVKNGGGVYNGSYSSLFMYSSALIGKVDGVSSAASSATACSNTAVYGGGIYNDSGSVYLGYKTTSSTNDLSGGVCYNYATGSDSEDAAGGGGGGISSVGGTVLIRAGNVSYNGCVDGGGGLYLKNGSNYKITGGEIKSNKAQTGGGLYVYSGEVSMSGGKFVSNVLTGTAAGNMGGAVFLLPGGPGVFKMSGTAYLPCTGQRENDICFAGNNDGTSKLIVTGKLTLPSGATTTKVARLTGANASRVLFDYTGTDSTFVKEANKFDVSYLSNTSYIIYSDGKLKKGGDATAALTSIEGATGGLTTVVINDSVSTGQLASLKAMMESQAASYPSAYIALDFTMADINSFVFGVKGSTSPANLRKVTLPKNCTVADYAFYSCTGLTTVVIPDGTTLSGHSFTKCSSLEELDLSNISASSNLREMCNGCTSLREITLPKSFDTSQDSLTRTFKDCTSLTTINYKGTIAEWNSAITNASELKMNVTTTITVKCTNGNTTL